MREIHRVLRPGGTCTVMLYNRSSINYYVEIMFLRKLFRHLLRPSWMPKLLAKVTGFDEWKLKGHQETLTQQLTHEQWVSMNTDGPYCPLAKVYNKAEADELFQDFAEVRQEVWEFNIDHWPGLAKILPKSMEHWIGRQWGWHRMIYARKA